MAYQALHYDTGKGATPALDAIVKTSRLRQNAQGFWQIHYSEPAEDGRWRSKTFSTRTQDFPAAQKHLTDWLTQAQQQRVDKHASQALTIGTLIDMYLQAKEARLERTTIHTYRTVQSLIGHLEPREFTQEIVNSYVITRENRRDGGAAKSATCRREIAAALSAIRYGARQKHVSPADLPMLDLPAQSLPRVRFMNHEQAQRFWDEAQQQGGQVALFVALGLETAARRSAIIDLTWDRVDLDYKIINYQDPKVRQTKKRRVTVRISNRLLPILEQAQRESGGRGRLFNSRLRHAYEAFIKRIGMEWVTAHIMRHTWASLAAINGVPLFHIAKMLGDTIATVEKTYAKLNPTDLDDAINSWWKKGA